MIDGLIICKAQGASGSVWGQGCFTQAGAGDDAVAMKNTAVVTVDTTAGAVLDITATWGTSSASNTITASNILIEAIDP